MHVGSGSMAVGEKVTLCELAWEADRLQAITEAFAFAPVTWEVSLCLPLPSKARSGGSGPEAGPGAPLAAQDG